MTKTSNEKANYQGAALDEFVVALGGDLPKKQVSILKKQISAGIEDDTLTQKAGYNGDGTGNLYHTTFSADGLPVSYYSTRTLRARWRKILEAVPEVILTAAGALATPYLALIGVLWMSLKIKGLATVELPEDEARVLLAMYRSRDGGGRANPEKVRNLYHEVCRAVRVTPLHEDNFIRAVHKLEQIGAIELDDGEYLLHDFAELSALTSSW